MQTKGKNKAAAPADDDGDGDDVYEIEPSDTEDRAPVPSKKAVKAARSNKAQAFKVSIQWL